MSGRTSHYGWSTLSSGDSFSDDSYKYTSADRIDMDAKVWAAAEGHHHLGGLQTIVSPPAAPSLQRSNTDGLIPAGTRVYYKISLVDVLGQESAASSEAYIDTPPGVTDPNPPSVLFTSTGGALLGGDYYYALSAYTGLNTSETRANGIIFLSVNSTTGTNKITLTLPTLPSGASGLNIYRRSPGESRYFYLASVDMTGATPPTTYVDNGSVAENCDRTVPTANTTNSQCMITVSYPGMTPIVPPGYTWKIYRTYLNGNYNKSLLKHVVEFTSEATPIITPYYTDIGLSTIAGTPLTTTPVIANPDKINLANAAEIQGNLPLGHTAFPVEFSFDFPATVTGATTGFTAWPCEFPAVTIIGCRASLGAGQTASGPVVVDVKKGASSATPTFSTIYTTTANRPRVESGQSRGVRTVPDIVSLVAGDLVTADVISVGGATPSAGHLRVTVYAIASGYPANTSYVPGTSTGT